MTHLFLSPHYDDAIYSCGGMIYQLAQHDKDVVILTIMAGRPSLTLPDTPVLKDNHERWQAGNDPIVIRRAEDQTAVAILGAKTQYLDVLDCIYRVAKAEALYPSEDSLWGDIHPDDPASAALEAIDLTDIDVIYAPMAIGKHVDHQIVRNWAWNIAQNSEVTVKFYQDYPYMRQQSAIKSALNYFDMPLKSETITLSETAMQHKVQAMSAYVSQISSFWENEAAIDTEVRQTFSNSSKTDYIEGIWYK